MGVPAFYKWLVKKYPMVVARALEEGDKAEVADTSMPNPNGIEFDNLYVDMNNIIHPCFHPDDDPESTPTTFEDVFHNICKYIDRLFNIVRPRKLLYMAIDGVAPRAKMNQQRTRRFRTAKDKEIRDFEEKRLRKQFEMEGKQVLPREEYEVGDPNVITPGTEFMHKLSNALQAHIFSKMASHDSSWRNIMVILSDANVPGEGEHKIMSFIRQQRSLPGYDPNTRHCLYGLDADLIMLALATHEPHFSILREDVLIQEQQPQGAANPFEFLHIWLLRESLELDMKILEQDSSKITSIDFERIVDDFVFICFFAGNDFLPHIPTLELNEEAIDLLITVYKNEFNKFGGYLVDMSKVEDRQAAFVKLSRVEKFILSVGTYEEKIFRKRSELQARKLRRLSRDYEVSKEEEENANLNLDPDNESSSASVFREKSCVSTDSDILQNTKELKEQLNRCIRQKSDLFKSGEFLNDKIRLGCWGWKARYYKVKFFMESPSEIESKRKEVVHKYTEGLLWILKYYYSGVPSWNWYYPFHYGPFASDLKGMGQVKMNFQKGVPFKPFDQLLAILPPGSSHALPKSYARLMEDEQSSIIDFYPTDFEVDTEGRRFTWQGICKIPFIDEGRLLKESRLLEKELTGEESVRNSVGADRLFLGNSNKLSSKIMSVSHNTASKFDTTISEHGIGGVLWLCNDNVENSVLCAYHELPVDGIHNPCLLPGLKLPEKTISENAILETELWHERQYDNRFPRPQIRNANVDGTTKFSPYDAASGGGRSRSSFESTPCASFKGAGYGRGKRSIGMGVDDKTPSLRPQGSYQIQTQQIVDGFKPFRISESSSVHQGEAKPCVWRRGRGANGSASQVNSWRNVSESSSRHQGDEKPCVWGRGRGAYGFASDVNSWRNVSDDTDSSSGHHQKNYTGKALQRGDQSRWLEKRKSWVVKESK